MFTIAVPTTDNAASALCLRNLGALGTLSYHYRYYDI